jgi:hypothetical protein
MRAIKIILSAVIISLFLPIPAYSIDTDFQEKKSTHFIVYYKKGVDTDFIDDIIESAESYYDEIANNLGYHRYNFWLWDDRAKIYIFKDKESYREETKQPEWSGGCALYQQKKLWTYPHAAGFFDSILPHELGHIIFREFVGFGNNVPLWFEEGVASYEEKSKRYAAKSQVKEFIAQNKIFDMSELSSINKPQDIYSNEVAQIFYAQAVSIVYFLINKFDNYRFSVFCKNLKEGMGFDQALDKAYYSIKDSQDLYKQWLRYVSE